ncbi:MAG: ATP synthase F1 subunit delta [Enterocloster sp.]
MAKLVSKVYGDALFEEAMEKNVLSQWYEEIGALRTIFLENPDLAQFLNHPQIIKEEKKKVVETIFSGKLSEGLLGFLVTVIEKGRQNDMIPICDYFTDRVKAYKKIGVVKVTSALPLSEDQKKRVEDRLLETTGFVSLETEYAVDESLLGGLVIRIGDRVVDSSIKTRLEEIRRDLMKLQLA